ncbi:MAG: DMT family transporter [Anaerolineae bacterium]
MRANLFLFFAVILWGIWGLANKYAVDRAHPFTVQWMFAVPLALSIPLFYWLGAQSSPATNHDPNAFLWAFIAGTTSLLGTVLLFFALQDRPASIATAVTSVYPLVTLLLAVLTRTEGLSPPRIIGIVLMVLGMIVLQFG